MSKKILIIACILISALLISCKATDNGTPTTSPTPTGTPNVASQPSTAPDAGYSITDDAYAEGDSIIRYPQIVGLTDMERQDQINTLLKDDATAIAEEGGTLDISYTVTWAGSRILSVKYGGVRTVPDAAYPNNVFYTTNVDIAKGTKIRLANMITVEPSFVTKIQEGEFVTDDPGLMEAEDLIRETVMGYNLYGALNNADNAYGAENPDCCFTYFTENALGISITVPHALGDHAEFEIGYPTLEGNYMPNSAWEDFGVTTTTGAAAKGIDQKDLYGDWVVSSHVASNPQGSTYSQEDIDAMIGKELTYAEDRASYDGEELTQPYYQMTKVAKAQFEADNSLTFEDLGIGGDSVVDITVYTDPEGQDVWVIPACFVFIVDKDHLIIRGDGEYFGLTRK